MTATTPSSSRSASRRCPRGSSCTPSPWLNLLLTPEAIRYRRRHALDPARFAYVGGAVRNEAPYELPYFPQAQ